MQQSRPRSPLPLSQETRNRLFGKFAYDVTPTPTNPEKITITDSWAKENLVTLVLPASIAAADGADVGKFHRLVEPRFLELVQAWDDAGVSEDILHWGGSYAARFMRGSTSSLSAHAWGSAFDINVPWNRLGQPYARLNEKGTVLRLVQIADDHGWAWGGRWRRVDAMHFELARL